MLCTLHLFINNNTMKYTISLLCICFYATLVSAQSPWTHAKGGGYAQVAFTNIGEYSEIFGDPDYELPIQITDRTLQLYAEYSVAEKSTIIIDVPFKMLCTGLSVIGNSDLSKNSLGNVRVAYKQGLGQLKGWTIAGIFDVEAPTGRQDLSDFPMPSGYDCWTFTPMFSVGKGFEKLYIQLFTGAGFRTNKLGKTFRGGGEIGYKLLPKLWGALFVDILLTDQEYKETPFALYVPNQEYGGFGFKFIGELGANWGLNLGLVGAFYGRNVAKAPAITFGVYTKW